MIAIADDVSPTVDGVKNLKLFRVRAVNNRCHQRRHKIEAGKRYISYASAKVANVLCLTCVPYGAIWNLQVAAKLIPKYIRNFPELSEEAINGQLDLCEVCGVHRFICSLRMLIFAHSNPHFTGWQPYTSMSGYHGFSSHMSSKA